MSTQKIQEWIVERRRLQQRSDSVENSSRDLVRTADDLAAKLRAFASDPIVVKHFIDFALPPKKRAEAAEVIAKKAWAAAKDHATEQGESATEQTGKPTKRLKRHDDSDRRANFEVFLSQRTAKTMADGFFKFAEQEHLLQHLSHMSAGQILVLCIFHSRLSWQKGKPLQLHDRDRYWIPMPTYTPASQVKSPSPPHFVQQIRQSATDQLSPEMQPPCTCCLCGEGFIDSPALWKHCEVEHHSWAEAVKRMLWEADQLEAMPLLPPDKRRIIQNFTNALTYVTRLFCEAFFKRSI